MQHYSAADWTRLGRAVYTARMAAGLADTRQWADQVGRSSRVLLGLERGEAIGTGTITRIEQALSWPPQYAYAILNNVTTEPPRNTPGSVGARTQTVVVDELRFRRPEGMSNEAWELLKARQEGYWQAQLNQAETER